MNIFKVDDILLIKSRNQTIKIARVVKTKQGYLYDFRVLNDKDYDFVFGIPESFLLEEGVVRKMRYKNERD